MVGWLASSAHTYDIAARLVGSAEGRHVLLVPHDLAGVSKRIDGRAHDQIQVLRVHKRDRVGCVSMGRGVRACVCGTYGFRLRRDVGAQLKVRRLHQPNAKALELVRLIANATNQIYVDRRRYVSHERTGTGRRGRSSYARSQSDTAAAAD